MLTALGDEREVRVALAALLPAGDLLRDLADLRHREGLGQNPLDARRLLFARADEFAPASDDRQRHLLVALVDEAQKLPAVHAGHPDVGEHAVELAGVEPRQRLRAAAGQRDLHALVLKDVAQQLAHRLFVVNHEYSCHPAPPIPHDGDALASVVRRQLGALGQRENDLKGRAPPDLRFDPDRPAVAADDAVRDGQAQPHALHALRRKEGVEDARTHLGGHAAAGVSDGDEDLLVALLGGEREPPARGHRVHGVEDHVDQNVAQLGGEARPRPAAPEWYETVRLIWPPPASAAPFQRGRVISLTSRRSWSTETGSKSLSCRWRAKSWMRLTVFAPSRADLTMRSRPRRSFGSSAYLSNSSARPEMDARQLLKSCATPEASEPTADSFSTCENCTRMRSCSST